MPIPQVRTSGDFTVTGTLVCECGPPPPAGSRPPVPATYLGNLHGDELILRILPASTNRGPFGPFTLRFDGATPKNPIASPCP